MSFIIRSPPPFFVACRSGSLRRPPHPKKGAHLPSCRSGSLRPRPSTSQEGSPPTLPFRLFASFTSVHIPKKGFRHRPYLAVPALCVLYRPHPKEGIGFTGPFIKFGRVLLGELEGFVFPHHPAEKKRSHKRQKTHHRRAWGKNHHAAVWRCMAMGRIVVLSYKLFLAQRGCCPTTTVACC